MTPPLTDRPADDSAESSSGTGNGTAALSHTGGPTLWWLRAALTLIARGGTLLLRRRS